MEFDNHYKTRYRSIPAASCDDIRTAEQIPYLIRNAEHPDTYITLPLHYHPEIEIILVRDGTWQFHAGQSDKYQLAKRGDIVFFMPYEQHEAFISEKNDHYSTLCMCFDPTLLIPQTAQYCQKMVNNLINGKQYLTQLIPHTTSENSIITEQFWNMKNALDSEQGCNEYSFFGALFTMFGILESYGHIHTKQNPNENEPADIQFARTVIDYTDMNFMNKISTADIASIVNYNESYFCRTFRRIFHMRYSEYLYRTRISKVCSMIHDVSISDAAFSCGFTHMGTFATNFKRYTGMTPTEYREQHIAKTYE